MTSPPGTLVNKPGEAERDWAQMSALPWNLQKERVPHEARLNCDLTAVRPVLQVSGRTQKQL